MIQNNKRPLVDILDDMVNLYLDYQDSITLEKPELATDIINKLAVLKDEFESGNFNIIGNQINEIMATRLLIHARARKTALSNKIISDISAANGGMVAGIKTKTG